MAVDIGEQAASKAQIKAALGELADRIDGDLRVDKLHRMLYSQDASVYQQEPLGVVYPRHGADVEAIVEAAAAAGIGLIPRSGGTSLAGQCVGPGLVVDVGRYMNEVVALDEDKRSVRVQPGVILDDLNRFLADYDLFFGPDTSTSNRCMIGGMVGNNSCGSHSILYGDTRAHVRSLEVVFADGKRHRVGPWDDGELAKVMDDEGSLGQGVRQLMALGEEHQELIESRYPRRDVLRRNTGYALDDIVFRAPFGDDGPFSLHRFLCGSEGTLGLVTEIELNLVDKPRDRCLVCVHFDSLDEALRATVEAVAHDPAAVELMDRRVLEETKNNIEQARNRFWVEGDPSAVLAVEFYRDTPQALEEAVEGLVARFKESEMGYAYPVVHPPKDSAVWALRKAGLGLLMGIEGDVKPVTVVEDTAVAVDVLPDYVRDFSKIMDAYGTACVYYAHASVGELHLRPELNLKDVEDVEKFKGIAKDVADLVRRYRGSLSGEHGDGRVRSPLLKRFYGEEIVELFRQVKGAFDPQGIFNPGNIVDPGELDDSFRFVPGQATPTLETYFKWRNEGGLVRATELCNGAGVCRKKVGSGGTMCPSYMATLEEKDSTRGRANTFRTLLNGERAEDAFESEELGEALSLCLSCKACKSECPASVDMAKMKAEYLQQRHDRQGMSGGAWFFGNFPAMSRLGMIWPWFANFMLSLALSRWVLNRFFGVTKERQMPALAPRSFDGLWKQYRKEHRADEDAEPVWLYVDPFTDFTEPEIGIAAVKVLEAAGYRVERFVVRDDGRTYFSKGQVKKARKIAEKGLEKAASALAKDDRPVIGLEPSALLSFRDEWLDLVDGQGQTVAEELGRRAVLFEEFLSQAIDEGAVEASIFAGSKAEQVVLHGHCHQKSLVGTGPTEQVLKAAGYEVETLATGCCGMAGSFGYEADHYELSMAIGELVLFPSLRELADDVVVVAPGTSCRDQIDHGVGAAAIHPAQALARRLNR